MLFPIKSRVQSLLKTYGLSPLKQLGQNFLIDQQMAEKILQALHLVEGERVLEIGPGLGAMTSLLLNQSIELTTLEIDHGVMRYLHDQHAMSHTAAWTLIHNDVLKQDWDCIYPGQSFKILSNVPYAITGPLLMQLLQARSRVTQAVLLLQDEVVQKMVAPVHSKDYSRLSVYFALWAEVKRVAKVPGQCFFPQPKVDSAVVSVRFKSIDEVFDAEELFRLVNTLFQQRRKTVASRLRGYEYRGLVFDEEVLNQSLNAVKIDPQARPQNLAPGDFIRLLQEWDRCWINKER